jgi:hypothetical protein
MRTDYPNADLINKVNSEWINKVLVHRELADPVDDDVDDDDNEGDLTMRGYFSRGEAAPAPREPVQVLADLSRLRHPPPSMTVKPTAPSSRPRSILRRVGQRLALGVAVLAVGAAVWIAQSFQEATNSVSVQEATAPPQQTAQADTTALNSAEPAWFAPEMLYATAIASPPTRRAETPPFLPRAGR